MFFSLNSKMRELEGLGVVKSEPRPNPTLKGATHYTFNGQAIQYLTDYQGMGPDGKTRFKVPTDIAWCPVEQKIVATAAALIYEQFRPLPKPLTIKNLPSKKNDSHF